MDKRFVLSVAGVAGAAVAAPALAEDITITMHLDFWAGEHGMSFSNGSGGVSSFVYGYYLYAVSSGTAAVTGSSFAFWNSSAISPYTSGFRWTINASVDAGDYNVLLTDTYGDGWVWGNASGADAFSVTGNVSGDTTIAFTGGFSTSGAVTVAPAPGALALLGLAGIAGRRKRN
jgi:MYXO-CTERM domain-containing protein